MEWLFLIYPVFGVLITLYVISRDSNYILTEGHTASNFFIIVFTVVVWPLLFWFALDDSLKYQAKGREK